MKIRRTNTISWSSAFLVLTLVISQFCYAQINQGPGKEKVPQYDLSKVPRFIMNQLGPFGPQRKDYKAPARLTIYAAPDGKEDRAGKNASRPTTLANAIERAKTGDFVVLRGGVYRVGDIQFSKQITIQPHKGEVPILKGSRIAKDWKPAGSNWVTTWKDFIHLDVPTWHKTRYGPKSFWHGDVVYINGEMLAPVDNLQDLAPGKFYCDYDKEKVYLRENPKGKTVEIIAYKYGLVRVHWDNADEIGPTIQGLTMMHYGSAAVKISGNVPNDIIKQGTMPRAPKKTRIENCRLLLCGRENIQVTSPEAIIKNNDISYSTYVGMVIHTSHRAVLEHNIIAHNGVWENKGFSGGIKIFNQSSNFIVRNNLVDDNFYNGIWYDVGHRDGFVYNNYFKNHKQRAVKIEISHRVSIANNVFQNNEVAVNLHNSANGQVYNNTFIDSSLHLQRENRGPGNDPFGWHASTGPWPENYYGHEVANNVFAGSKSQIRYSDRNTKCDHFQTSLFSNNVFNSKASPLFTVMFNQSDSPKKKQPFPSLEKFRKSHSQYEKGSVQLNLPSNALFQSMPQGDLRLKPNPAIPLGVAIPKNINDKLGWKAGNVKVGAFSSLKQ